MASTYSLFDVSLDPARGLRQSHMPINMGEGLLPHAITFQSTMSSISKVYRPSDEALKHSLQNARLMRNDPVIMECVEMRQRACCLFDWHIEPGDKNDPTQVAIAEELKAMIEAIPRFIQYRENLLNATWYGRYGVQHQWGWKKINGKQRMTVKQWQPVNGDKIVFRYDDGLDQFRPDQVGIRIGFTYHDKAVKRWQEYLDDQQKLAANTGRPTLSGKIQPTDFGLAYFLDTWERPLLALHKHQIEDGEYEEPTNAGRLHGKGLRSVLYWPWLQKQEALALLMEYLERSAFGFNIVYFPAHNPQAKEAIQDSILRQSESGGSRNVVFFPFPQDDTAGLARMEHIEPGMGGVESLKYVIHEYFGHEIKRYVLGQTLTSEASATGLGSNLAEVQLGTFMGIVRYDATLEEETHTTDLLHWLLVYNFPQYVDAGFRFRIDTEVPDAEARLEAISKAYAMGLKIPAQTLRDLLGISAPEDDEEVLDMVAQQKATQPPPMMGGGGSEEFAREEAFAGDVHSPNASPIEDEAYSLSQANDGGDRDRMIQSSDERVSAGRDNGHTTELLDMFTRAMGLRRKVA